MLYRLYAALFPDGGASFNYSPALHVDKSHLFSRGCREMWIFNRPLPLWLAAEARDGMERLCAGKKQPIGPKDFNALLRKTASGVSEGPAGDGFARAGWEREVLDNVPGEYGEELRLAEDPEVSGRILLEAELLRRGRQNGLQPGRLLAGLQKEILEGTASRRPGVEPAGKYAWVCGRCGERDQFYVGFCPVCRAADCVLCLACRQMGEVRRCQGIYTFAAPPGDGETPDAPFFSAPLTPAQREISGKLVDWYKSAGQSELLLWAVCGAGKTEIIFPLLAHALKDGKRILIASPRREVLKELDGRFTAAFPGLAAAFLTGESRRIPAGAKIYLATAHQVLRFFRFFDLIILDEEDAFPYHENRMLPFAVHRSRAAEGKTVYLTATPRRRLWERLQKDSLPVLILPERYHGFALPEPRYVRTPALNSGRIDWIERHLQEHILESIQRKRIMLVFYPTIRRMREDIPAWESWCHARDYSFGHVHADDPGRAGKIEALRRGDCHVFLSTTVLERGVNFRGVDAAVLYADEERIYRREVLVQIAGRVGRYADDQDGKVYFFGGMEGREMKEAAAMIRYLNRLAGKTG
ncbi:MAG: helicase-related protein [Bacillota bacterium]